MAQAVDLLHTGRFEAQSYCAKGLFRGQRLNIIALIKIYAMLLHGPHWLVHLHYFGASGDSHCHRLGLHYKYN